MGNRSDEVEQLQLVRRELASISVKLDTLIADKADHEKRIRELETTRWLFAGGCIVVLSFLQVAIQKFVK